VKIGWFNSRRNRQVWQNVLRKAMAKKWLVCQWRWCSCSRLPTSFGTVLFRNKLCRPNTMMKNRRLSDGWHKEQCLLGSSTVYNVETQPTFRKNIGFIAHSFAITSSDNKLQRYH
jgi:hypothetical protein